MKKTAKSLGHSLSGLRHAINTESNIQKFLIGEIVVLMIGIWLDISVAELIFVLICGAAFLIVELFNTAFERLADTFDDDAKKHHGGHYHVGVKQTKDVAAAASLIALLINGLIIVIIYLPYVIFRFYPNL